MITVEKLKFFDAFKGDFDAYARSIHNTENKAFIDNEWQLIQNFKHDIGLINKGLSSNDYNHKAIENIKNYTEQNAFDLLSNKITGYSDFQKVGQLLRKVRAKIKNDTNVMWTSFDNTKSLIQEIESDIISIESCDRKTLEKIKVNFLPTSSYQEISLSNNWGDEYLKLASDFDIIYSKLTKYIIKKRSLRKIGLYSSIVVLYGLVPLLVLAAIGTLVIIKYEVEPGYLTIEQNKNLSDSQKINEHKKIEQKETKLSTEYYLLLAGGIISLVTATGLTVKRRKIISGKKAAHNSGFGYTAG